MTERCHTNFESRNNNQNFIIYTGIATSLLAILYFYKFHLVTIIFSYVLGCLACYYGLKLGILQRFWEQILCHFIRKPPDKDKDTPVKGCNACGSKNCDRHGPDMAGEPWSGLLIHKQLDQSIEDFYNTILEQFINTWYSKITLQPFFVDELRHQLRYASASLVRRALKINYARFIIDSLVPCALRHVTVDAHVRAVHVAASSRDAELRYLRSLTETLMPYLLRNSEVNTPVFRVLVREILAGWVLLPLTDALADPHELNTLVVLATGDETMAASPLTPNYEVEFLENFVRQSEVYGQRPRLLRVDLEMLISRQDHFYALMQHLKTTNSIYVLQFYKDIKSFQSQILNPELSTSEQKNLYSEAKRLYHYYLDAEVPHLELPPALLQELQGLLDEGPAYVTRLQTSKALYQAARQSQFTLEKFMLPRFLHSEEFYKLFIGPRVTAGYQKQMTKRPQDKFNLSKIANRLRSRKPLADGQELDSLDGEDRGDIDEHLLQYLDSLVADDSGDHDLSTYKVVLTNVERRLQAAPRRGTVRVFTLGVHRADPRAAQLWAAERSEHDFHLLRSKLLEFHGETLLAELPLPSRRDNSPLETLRYKYEDFLQRLLRIRLLQSSELLHAFLTADGDFALAVQASAPATTDLGHIYHSVAHRLRKERGQHLEAFLANYLVCADKERYQALKQGTREVEEAQEVSEYEELHRSRPTQARNVHASVFGDNFGVHCAVTDRDAAHQQLVRGFTQCAVFTLVKLVRAPVVLTRVLGTLLGAARSLVDSVFTTALDTTLRSLLNERRLAHLIRLGHELLFGKLSSPRVEAEAQREKAARRLNAAVPGALATLVPGLRPALAHTHHMLQNPALNKQLVYNLLDLCVLELFPELSNEERS